METQKKTQNTKNSTINNLLDDGKRGLGPPKMTISITLFITSSENLYFKEKIKSCIIQLILRSEQWFCKILAL